ncbi:MAG: GIY-YIG nuclease family protein [Gammaproteobacteria bacterium]
MSASSYQLHIRLAESLDLQVGRLGQFRFPAGDYIYTGSAKRHMEARLARHQRREKPLRWHIDYLTSHSDAVIQHIERSDRVECEWNQATKGQIVAAGFGASDCKSGCGSHLKYLGPGHD